MDKQKSSERIKELITQLIFQDNYWGYLFSKINRKEDLTLQSLMGVSPEIDGTITLLYNPLFIDLADDEFLKIIIEHEGIHILNNHIPRLLRIISNEVNKESKSKKIDKWNFAADCAVNTLINIKKSYVLGDDLFEIVHPDYYDLPHKKTAEFYYLNIPDSNDQKKSGSKDIDDHGSWTKNNSNVSDIGSLASRLQQYTESILEESFNNVLRKGNLPNYIVEKIDEILKPPQIPYYQLIKKLVKGSRLSKQKRAYTRINKKRVYTFFIGDKNLPMISPFPGKTKDFSFNITIILDTSGSMSKEQILEGLSGVKNIIENDKYCKTIVIECDVIIHKEYEVKRLKDIDFSISGRGGTKIFPALSRCKELNTDVTLVFTDGECDNINEINRTLLPKKIIYVLTKAGTSKVIDRTGYIVRLPE